YDRAGRRRVGHVTSLDIQQLHLPADLVVLSACETAGERVPGEGLLGLAHAFFEAGARVTIASLWRVDDEATWRLMARFSDGLLRRGLPPALAMAEAKRAVRGERKEWNNPYFWAGFVVQGDGFYTKSAAPGFRSRTPAPPAP